MSGPEDVTYDTLLRGKVKLIQPSRGFRSSLDPVLLAAFARPPFGRFLDIGCGTGALSFLLLAADSAATGTGVEIQPRLADLARRGIAENGFEARFALFVGDARTLGRSLPAGSCDLVATNPPFRPIGTGVLPAEYERSLANHEVALKLADWLDLGVHALAPAGRLVAIFPANRTTELVGAMRARGLLPARMRAVQAQASDPPKRILVEARRASAAGGALVPVPDPVIEPPLVVHEGGRFSREVLHMIGEGQG
jgi:tRNA1Val (adenine37-N6)-methyltransferase